MTRRLQTRATLASNRLLLVGLCLALALAGGWLSYGAYWDPGTDTEERTVSEWTSTAAFDHEATVTKQNALYDTGRTLVNRPVYFTTISPVVDGEFTYSYEASDGGNLTVATNTTLVVQQVEEDRTGNVTVLWETTEPLGALTRENVAPGQAVSAPFSFNASAVADRIDAIDDDLENPPGQSRAFVTVAVDLRGTVNGQQVDRTERYELPLDVGTTFRVADPGVLTEDHERTETIAVASTPGAFGRFGGPLLLAVGLFGLFGLVVADRRGLLTIAEADRERLAHAADRGDFDEWISVFSLPPETEARPVAHANSLSDLVDFAIDTDSGVVEDPETGVYSVLHGDLRYVYVPPGARPRSADRPPVAIRSKDPQFGHDAVQTDGGDGASDDESKSESESESGAGESDGGPGSN
jgi:hypothetical protein